MKSRKTALVLVSLLFLGLFSFASFVPSSAQPPEECWYWKPDKEDYAPSGVPDFDQTQNPSWVNPNPPVGTWSWCGPTAVANSLWWLDSKFESAYPPPADGSPWVQNYGPWDDHDPGNVPPLIEDLARYMLTDVGKCGTNVFEMEMGIEAYLHDRGLDLQYYEHTVEMPNFSLIEEEVERCEDVILLLGFWQWQDYPEPGWVRVGGHYVTVAGVNSWNWWIAFSDPLIDNAEVGGPGRVRPVSPHPPLHPILHNDAAYVSHDMYKVLDYSNSPGGIISIEGYPTIDIIYDVGQNLPEKFIGQNGTYNPEWPNDPTIYTEVEYAVIISSKPWHWKADKPDYAPSGMPDFSQMQNASWVNPNPPVGTWSWCGPTAVANCLWWMDSRFEPYQISPPNMSDGFPLVSSYNATVWDDHDPRNVPPLIKDLAALMGTDTLGRCGTDVYEMEWGIQDYLVNKGLDWLFYEHTIENPDYFLDIEKEVEGCEDVILLLGFWQWQEYPTPRWVRVGGHYVTVAGVESEQRLMALSDPILDNAEAGFSGRVRPYGVSHPHSPVPPDPTHNNASYVSHDIYYVNYSITPGGPWKIEDYPARDIIYNVGQNLPEKFIGQNGTYNPNPPNDPTIYTEIEFAVVISPKEYWKANYTDYAPSGVPDFDQTQNASWVNPNPPVGTWSWCGPTAVANCLWWLDSRFQINPLYDYNLVGNYGPWDDHNPQNVPYLIADLAAFMNTDVGKCGTEVHEMETGIQAYLASRGGISPGDLNSDGYVDFEDLDILADNWMKTVPPGDPRADLKKDGWINILDLAILALHWHQPGAFYERTVKAPTFDFIEEEVERSEDVILLLGFWQVNETSGHWNRVGGHYVTVAGVWSSNYSISISDPILDRAVQGLRGRVLPPTHPPAGAYPPTLHNNASFVSHDTYMVGISPSPGGWEDFGLIDYPAYEVIMMNGGIGQNCPSDFVNQTCDYIPGLPIFTEVEYAVIISPVTYPLVHDVAIRSVTASPTTVTPGQVVNVQVMVENQGDFTESFNVTAYYDGNPIGTPQTVINIPAPFIRVLSFTWNTMSVPPGTYTISANASIVPGETDIADNSFTDGTVTVLTVHDVAIINVTPAKTVVGQGYKCKINVTAENQGNVYENFNVSVYYRNATGDYLIETQTGITLAAGASINLTFTWDTKLGVQRNYTLGYTIFANATVVPGETETGDNTYTDGTVKVVIPGNFNADNQVNVLDLGKMGVHWGPAGKPYNANVDINCNGEINVVDLGILGVWWLAYE